jgi:hypothetical protein
METITLEDRLAVLENKLKVAESALYGCRAIIHYVRRTEYEREDTESVSPVVVRGARQGDDGLYPGQFKAQPPQDEEDFDPAEAGKSEQECVE